MRSMTPNGPPRTQSSCHRSISPQQPTESRSTARRSQPRPLRKSPSQSTKPRPQSKQAYLSTLRRQPTTWCRSIARKYQRHPTHLNRVPSTQFRRHSWPKCFRLHRRPPIYNHSKRHGSLEPRKPWRPVPSTPTRHNCTRVC